MYKYIYIYVNRYVYIYMYMYVYTLKKDICRYMYMSVIAAYLKY